MIIVLSDRVNDISQEMYDSVIESMDRNTIQCDQCSQCGFHINGYYYKTIRASRKILKILIVQLICPHCGRTYAVLLSSMIPWSSVQLKDAIRIVCAEDAETIRRIMDDDPNLSENIIKRCRRSFLHEWKERLLSFFIRIDEHLTENCIKYHRRQFLQNRCSSIFLFRPDHIGVVNPESWTK